jgi:hypothetical protein
MNLRPALGENARRVRSNELHGRLFVAQPTCGPDRPAATAKHDSAGRGGAELVRPQVGAERAAA